MIFTLYEGAHWFRKTDVEYEDEDAAKIHLKNLEKQHPNIQYMLIKKPIETSVKKDKKNVSS